MKKYLFVFLILLLLTGCNFQNSHSHTQCPECSKCISEDCNGTENEKCQGHQPVHTHTECQECGKCIAKDCDGAEELKCSGHEHHIYKLTIIDEDNLIYDKPTETSCESDTKIVMHSRPIIDADLAMYINGEFQSIQNTIIVNDEYVWEYSFIMPERDTTIEFKTQVLEYFDVKTILGIPSLTREDILRIIYHTINLSSDPIPGSLRIVISTTDYEDITSMLCFLDANVVEDRSNNWQEDAGSCEKYSICTIDKKYDFEIINGYISVNNKHYKLLGYGPGMSYGNITSAFNTNLDSYEAYTLDGTKIGTFNGLSEFEFYEIKAPLTGVDDYGYLETEFGRIYIHDSKTFYIKDGENYTYYKLVWEWEKDFSDIFNKHTHTECEECGKCNAEDCDGLEEEKCQGCNIVNLVDKTYVSFINVDDYELQTNYIIINSYDEYINFVIDNFLMEIQFGPSNGLYYTDEFYSVINNYDEQFFEKNSLIFCYMDKLHSRINPRMVYQVELKNGILKIHETLSGDDCPPNFKGKIFYNIEISKNVINANLNIEFIGDKIIIYD